MRDERYDDKPRDKVEKSDVWRKRCKPSRSYHRDDDSGPTWLAKLVFALIVLFFFCFGAYVARDYYKPLMNAMVPRTRLADEVAKRPTVPLRAIANGRKFWRLVPKTYFRNNVLWAADPKNPKRDMYIHLAADDIDDLRIVEFVSGDRDLRGLARAVLRRRK